MSNELFDKKIKQQLEKINRPVGKNVWDKVQSQMAVPWYHDFWRRFALPTYSVITTILLLFSLKEILNNKTQISLLNDKISTTQIKPEPTIQTIVNKDTIYVYKTVYITQKETSKSVRTTESSIPSSARQDDKLYTLEAPKEVFISNLPAKENSTSQSLAVTDTDLPKNTNSANNSITDAAKSDSVQVSKKDSVVALSIPKPTEDPEPQKKKFKLPKLNTRFGISGGVGIDGDVSLGPMTEIFLGKNLGLSTGLIFNRYPQLEYSSPKQFNAQTGQDFLYLYNNQIPANYDALTEIQISTSILELPLYLNYYIPIKRKLDLKLTFGTHIDLKLYQNIRFETYRSGEEVYTEFNTYAAENTWHNLILGLGLQYKHKSMVFQLTPTYLYNYREVDYIASGGAFRINGGVLFNLRNK